MRSPALIIAAVAFFASLSFNYFQYIAHKKTEFLLNVETTRGKINNDMINELMIQNNGRGGFADESNSVKYAETQGFIKGITSVVTRVSPQESEISGIWHAGYERGLSQTDFVGELQYEKGYGAGFSAGQRENMKAINTIVSSGKNIQDALKEFANNIDKQEGKTPATEAPKEDPKKENNK